jgi:hypothetical protein
MGEVEHETVYVAPTVATLRCPRSPRCASGSAQIGCRVFPVLLFELGERALGEQQHARD